MSMKSKYIDIACELQRARDEIERLRTGMMILLGLGSPTDDSMESSPADEEPPDEMEYVELEPGEVCRFNTPMGCGQGGYPGTENCPWKDSSRVLCSMVIGGGNHPSWLLGSEEGGS